MNKFKTVVTAATMAGLLAAGIGFFMPQNALALSCGVPEDLPSGCQYQFSHTPCTACGPGFVGVRKVGGPAACPIAFCADLY